MPLNPRTERNYQGKKICHPPANEPTRNSRFQNDGTHDRATFKEIIALKDATGATYGCNMPRKKTWTHVVAQLGIMDQPRGAAQRKVVENIRQGFHLC